MDQLLIVFIQDLSGCDEGACSTPDLLV